MKCALAGVGFINEDIEYNKAVLADTLRKCAGRADVVIFGEAFLQGFYGINFIAKHDTTVSISRDDMIIREICSMAKEYTIAVSFGFIEKENEKGKHDNRSSAFNAVAFAGCDDNFVFVFLRT